MNSKKIVVAFPKGRILDDFFKDPQNVTLKIEGDFFNESSRKLSFKTNIKNLEVIKVRSFDVPTIVAKGGADVGISGSDVLEEFSFTNIYTVFNLKIGKCSLALASKKNLREQKQSHVPVATKYVNLTKAFFAKKSIQAETIKLNGSIEIASKIGLCNYIVDLVSSGRTLEENNMEIKEVIMSVCSKVIVNKASLKTKNLSEILNTLKLFA